MSPRTQQQFKEMREEKMTLIMEVALEHFANEGFYRTTINHIARHAKMSKGLMYNYFESKEALLKAIIHKSVNEIYRYLDFDKDASLSEKEFEFSIQKLDTLLQEKRYFWRLLLHLFMQNDVRDQFLNAYPESDSLVHPGHEPGDNYYPTKVLKMVRDYFYANKEKKGNLYDPDSEIQMFFITLLGYAVKTIYSERQDDKSDIKPINRIIEIYK